MSGAEITALLLLCYALVGTLLRQWLANPQHGGRRKGIARMTGAQNPDRVN